MAGVLWWALRPSNPSLPTYQQTEKYDTAYRPGGSKCDPTQLRGLSGAEAISETNRCRESAEQHRLQSSDLIQQTRAADAATSGALLSYNQTLIALAGTIVGFFTLIAAVLAALYAKKAAEAAERGISHSRDTSRQELRAYLACQEEKVSRSEVGKKPFTFSMKVRNVGSTPAHHCDMRIAYVFVYDNGGRCELPNLPYAPITLAAGATSDVAHDIILDVDEARAFGQKKGHIGIFVEAEFVDDFGEHWVFRQKLIIVADGMKDGTVYTEACNHTKTERTSQRSHPPSRLRLPQSARPKSPNVSRG